MMQGCCKATSRLLQGLHDVRRTDVRVRHKHICLTKAARLPTALRFMARLSQECCETYYYC